MASVPDISLDRRSNDGNRGQGHEDDVELDTLIDDQLDKLSQDDASLADSSSSQFAATNPSIGSLPASQLSGPLTSPLPRKAINRDNQQSDGRGRTTSEIPEQFFPQWTLPMRSAQGMACFRGEGNRVASEITLFHQSFPDPITVILLTTIFVSSYQLGLDPKGEKNVLGPGN